jgi:hypothetical protein
MLYHPTVADATNSLTTINGRNLAHSHRSASERAGLAAQLILGEARLVKPTITQIAPIASVCVPYVQVALKLSEATRNRVVKGELTLADAAKANGLLSAWFSAAPAEKAALGIAVGVDRIWDDVIALAI